MMPNTYIFKTLFKKPNLRNSMHEATFLKKPYYYKVRSHQAFLNQTIPNSMARSEYFESLYPLFWQNLLLTCQKTVISNVFLINLLELEGSVRWDSMPVFKGTASLSHV